MELEDLIKKIDVNLERIDENAKKIESNFENIKKNSYALEFIKDYKSDSRKWFITLIVVLCMWFATIGGFLYYINTTGYSETEEVADTSEGGNACVGDNCNNGDVNYGKSE